MGPIELTYLMIGITITLIGLARGYVKELGSTLIILVAIFILTFFQDRLASILSAIGTTLLGIESPENIDVLVSTTFTILFVAIVFAGYSGRTLAFTGTPAPPPQGTILSLIVGMLNGYLIAGTLWYYQDFYGYPISQFIEVDSQLTERATNLVNYLPPVLFENPVYWIVPVAILMIIRVRG